MKKILITGGAGFIGYHLAKRLAEQGHKIVLVDNFFRSNLDNDLKSFLENNKKAEFIEADLTKYSEWEDKIIGPFDQVYHLAAVNGTGLFYDMPEEVLRINILTTLNAVEWMRNHNKQGKILFTSSNEAYAGARESFDALPYPTPEDVPLVISDVYNPRWTYAGTKILGEQLLIFYAHKYGFRMSIVRPHNFYGPRAGYKHVIPELLIRTHNKIDPFPVYGFQDKRSFCYIDDAVKAMIMVMDSDKTDGKTYHIGSQEERKVKNIVETIFILLNWRPKELVVHESPSGSVKRRLPDISKIEKDTGWRPETSFEEGLKRTWEWYEKNPKK